MGCLNETLLGAREGSSCIASFYGSDSNLFVQLVGSLTAALQLHQVRTL